MRFYRFQSLRTPFATLCTAFLLLFSASRPMAAGDGRSDQGKSSYTVQFTTFEQAAPVLRAAAHASDDLPEELSKPLKAGKSVTPELWSAWVRDEDRATRLRLDRGEEDTITDFLRFGQSFTQVERISNRSLLSYGTDPGVTAAAKSRAGDLIRAMAAAPKSGMGPGVKSGSANERIAHARDFVEQHGYSLQGAEAQQRLESYLLANVARMRDEFLSYLNRPASSDSYDLFKNRGISLDTNLWPDFLIDRHLAHMLQEGLLRPGSVRRVAIIGPGLDFSNKEAADDFYPPQTVQPFAVLDSLLRLGLAKPGTVEVYTLDISPEVNFHVDRTRRDAMAGEPAIVQLPWDTRAPLSEEYRNNFVHYWKGLGGSIGEPVPPIPVPASAAERTETRAIRIRPELVRRVSPLDINVVCQTLQPAGENEGFDLVIATNVLVYYSRFEQSLARVNVAHMLRPGGFLLSNDRLPEGVDDGLSTSLMTSQVVAREPEHMFSYRKAERQ